MKPSLWSRVREAVAYVLALEPVAVQAVARAVFVLAGAVGLVLPEWVEPRVAGVIVAFYALVEVITTVRARRRTVPVAASVERVTPNGEVVAGPANDLVPDGVVVRTLGEASPPTGPVFPG